MMMPLEERRAHRLQFLREVYDASGGVTGKFFRWTDIGESLGFDEEHSDELASYLVAEGLLQYAAMGVIELTHYGLKEVEQSISNPEQATEHFPAFVVAQNYMHVESMNNSQVQQGTVGSVQVSDQARGEVGALVTELRQTLAEFDLSDDQRAEAEADLTTTETQLASPRPKVGVIRESLASVRSILEGAAGSGLAASAPHLPALIEKIGHVLAMLG